MLAIEQYNKYHPDIPLDTNIRLLPYQLNPGMSSNPMTRQEMYEKKFGVERAASIREGMIARFAQLGYRTYACFPNALLPPCLARMPSSVLIM